LAMICSAELVFPRGMACASFGDAQNQDSRYRHGLVGRGQVKVDVRHRRRALSSDDILRLIDSARTSGVSIQEYDGETRARIYTLSYLTGLRRGEIASLTPRSFSLDAPTPTVTVEAAYSKRRRRDVLPLHPELVALLREWLADVPDDSRFFPKLARRRTWLMVKLDLERIGIPYVTPEGIADFHAAGRHTHITELLRNGATLPEARELARHSDIKMTMHYTHIGMADQAKALRQLPWDGAQRDRAPEDSKNKPNDQPLQRIGSVSGGLACHSGSLGDTGEGQPLNDATPVADRGCHKKTSSGTTCQEWRRRESNPRPVISPRKLLRA